MIHIIMVQIYRYTTKKRTSCLYIIYNIHYALHALYTVYIYIIYILYIYIYIYIIYVLYISMQVVCKRYIHYTICDVHFYIPLLKKSQRYHDNVQCLFLHQTYPSRVQLY